VSRPRSNDLRHQAGLDLGRLAAALLAGEPFEPPPVNGPPRRPPPRPARSDSRAERLLLMRDWVRLEGAHEALGAEHQRVLDLRYGLSPCDRKRHTVTAIAAALGSDRATISATLKDAIAAIEAAL
jgi:hypothetical protein